MTRLDVAKQHVALEPHSAVDGAGVCVCVRVGQVGDAELGPVKRGSLSAHR